MSTLHDRLKELGPGAMVTAAFIGPGTVVAASMAGAQFGFQLLWAILLSALATFVLQEMAARLGIQAKMGLGEALRLKLKQQQWARLLASLLIIGAIFIGNAAYEAGNIAGAVWGLPFGEIQLGAYSLKPAVLLVGSLAFAVLYTERQGWITQILIGLVAMMSLVFLCTAIALKPSVNDIFMGCVSISIPAGGEWGVLGLIGTTVVPYNLFLHASASQRQGGTLMRMRWDTGLSIAIGGLITLCIAITSAMAFYALGKTMTAIADLPQQLASILGDWVTIALGIGFFAAGISSAITAPLAAAYAVAGVTGRAKETHPMQFRAIWMFVLFAGLTTASIGLKPLSVILFAQIANGMLLPIIAIFLLWVMNDQALLQGHHNKLWRNLLGLVIILLTCLLGTRQLLLAFGWI